MAEFLELTFSSGGPSSKRVGPHRSVRFEGEVLRAQPGGPLIAKHENHEWHVDGEKYTRLDCECRVIVHFERVDGSRSRTYGPYAHVSFIDGVAYADRSIFAFVDRAIVDWYCHEDGSHWPLMIIAAAA